MGTLVDRGYPEADLWVIEGNERARRFYEAGGWAADGSARSEVYGETPVRLLRYRRRFDGAPVTRRPGVPAAGG